jgi:hypothetical protein
MFFAACSTFLINSLIPVHFTADGARPRQGLTPPYKDKNTDFGKATIKP